MDWVLVMGQIMTGAALGFVWGFYLAVTACRR